MTLAEELHFRRSAEKLGVSQPPLSMAIQSLERELGLALFHRTRRTVSLTAAGQRYHADAKRILASLSEAALSAKRAAEGEDGQLRIGLTPSAAFNRIVPSILRTYRARFPAVDFSLSEANTLVHIEAVRAGALDGAFVRPTDIKLAGLVATTVVEEPMLAAVSSRHRLADAETISLSALKGETIILRPRPIGERLVERIVSACEGAGFSPIIAHQDAPQMTSILSLVAAELGITFVPASMAGVYSDFVVYKRVSSDVLPPALLSLVRRPIPTPTLTHFEIIVEQHKSRDSPQ
ncbi:LysR family transcriptional regulator [Bosea sp. PAMC 26642]|uniref:LysR family transcriptional regulator n=1 Tax=Bosea sp. (strain PAMC 26642) TaxID=1792307 RepID=UPI00143B99A9|nr:LysR family transcriptional regulator [Bosea sp. PAMC 26642]